MQSCRGMMLMDHTDVGGRTEQKLQMQAGFEC